MQQLYWSTKTLTYWINVINCCYGTVVTISNLWNGLPLKFNYMGVISGNVRMGVLYLIIIKAVISFVTSNYLLYSLVLVSTWWILLSTLSYTLWTVLCPRLPFTGIFHTKSSLVTSEVSSQYAVTQRLAKMSHYWFLASVCLGLLVIIGLLQLSNGITAK